VPQEDLREGDAIRTTRPRSQALWPEAAAAFVRRVRLAIARRFRASWLYRRSFRGPIPDRILFHPADTRGRQLEEADAYLRGRFRFAGATLEIREGSVFDRALPNAAFAAGLHGFQWLRHLEAAGGPVAHDLALALAQQWLRRYQRVAYPAWNPEIIAERFFNVFSHGRFFLLDSDLVWRSRFFVSLRNQARVLARTLHEAPAGLPRLKAAAALTLAGFCLGDRRSTSCGLKALSRELEAQVLPDGGAASRSPEALLESFRVLGMVEQALGHAHHPDRPALKTVLGRIAPMLRYFRLGDGGLGVFHGGGEADARVLAAELNRDEAQVRAVGHAPYSGYQRLSAGRATALFDVGCEPPPEFAGAAHAGALAFELSSGAHRLVVNCGPPSAADARLRTALRSTAAHSTLSLADTSSASVLDGRLAAVLGARLIAGPMIVDTRRSEGPLGVTVEAEHDGYARRLRVIHWRRLTLAPRGLALTGADRLLPIGQATPVRDMLPFAIRFHIHPDVRISMAQGGGSVLLKLPNGEGWRFRCGGGRLSVEESIYFGGGAARRAEQLVITSTYTGEPLECAWLFELVASP
jgi:uncharacterized heparinase superfamily protein